MAYKDIILIDIKVINIYKISLSNQKSVSLRYVFQLKENLITDQINDVKNKIFNIYEEKTQWKSHGWKINYS